MSDVKPIVLILYSVRRRFGRSKLTFLFTFKSHSLLTMNFSDTFYNKIFDARFATIQALLKFVPKKFIKNIYQEKVYEAGVAPGLFAMRRLHVWF